MLTTDFYLMQIKGEVMVWIRMTHVTNMSIIF
jgi:hypothetical protein